MFLGYVKVVGSDTENFIYFIIMRNSDDEDTPCFSSETLKALQEFLDEQSLKQNRLENHVTSNGNELAGTSEIDENWVRCFLKIT